MERKRRKTKKLYEAAEEGNVSSLLSLLQEDKHILDRSAFAETPLHVAAMLGHLEFSKEIINLKPELVNVLDFGKRSALHLAAANGHLEVVKALLMVDPEMCFVQGRDGRNPLHTAVVRGQIVVLKELVQAKPEAVLARTNQGETVLHLCVKRHQLEALQFLVGMIDDPEFVNSKDDDGFTVLQRAVAEKQIQIIKFLIANTAVDTNAQNADGFTPLDLVLADTDANDSKDMDIKDLLIRAGGVVSAEDQDSGTNLLIQAGEVVRVEDQDSGTNLLILAGGVDGVEDQDSGTNLLIRPGGIVSAEDQDSGTNLLIRAGEVVGAEDQDSGTNLLIRPGRVDQDSGTNLLIRPGRVVSAEDQDSGTTSANASSSHLDTEKNDHRDKRNWLEQNQNAITVVATIQAAAAFLAGYNPPGSSSVIMYGLFITLNTTAVLVSLFAIILLLTGLPLKNKFIEQIMVMIIWVAVSSMAMSYLIWVSSFSLTNQKAS